MSPIIYKKQIICRFCGEKAYAHFNRTYCYKEECKEAKRQEYLQRDKNRVKKKRIKGISILKGLPDKNFRPNAWPTENGYKKIKCLKCKEEFLSEGKHNRICDVCNRLNVNKLEEIKLGMEGLV